MSYTAHTEYRCSVNIEKEYTSFRWDLPDFGLLREYYKNVASSEFMITNTDTKCHLEFELRRHEPEVEVPVTPPTSMPSSTFGRNSLFSNSSTQSTKVGIFCSSPQATKSQASISQSNEYAYVHLHFPPSKIFEKMKVIVSLIGASGEKTKSVSQTRNFVDGDMTFKLIDAHNLFNSLGGSSYMRNDTMTILCEIIHIKKQESVITDIKKLDDHFSNDVQRNLQVFFKSEEFCDVTFVVGDTEFHGHQVVLAANSPVLEAKFKTEMTEQIKKTVKVEDIDAITFKAFLNYIYTGSVEKMDEIVENLLVVAEKYQVLCLRNLCETYIADHLDKENAVKYLVVAHLHNFEALKTKAVKFIRSCKQQIAETDFTKLCIYPELVTEIFRTPS